MNPVEFQPFSSAPQVDRCLNQFNRLLYAPRHPERAGNAHLALSSLLRINPMNLPLPGGVVLRYLAPQEGTAHRAHQRNCK